MCVLLTWPNTEGPCVLGLNMFITMLKKTPPLRMHRNWLGCCNLHGNYWAILTEGCAWKVTDSEFLCINNSRESPWGCAGLVEYHWASRLGQLWKRQSMSLSSVSLLARCTPANKSNFVGITISLGAGLYPCSPSHRAPLSFKLRLWNLPKDCGLCGTPQPWAMPLAQEFTDTAQASPTPVPPAPLEIWEMGRAFSPYFNPPFPEEMDSRGDPSCYGNKEVPGWLSSVRASVDSKGFQWCD